jgi:hypothetical protein
VSRISLNRYVEDQISAQMAAAIVTGVVVGSFCGRRLRNFPDGVWIFDRISIDSVESFRDLSDTVWLFDTRANQRNERSESWGR